MNDVKSDEMFYMQYSNSQSRWLLYDCGTVTHSTNTMNEMREYVMGVWDGMKCFTEVSLTCAIYTVGGTLIDTMVSGQ